MPAHHAQKGLHLREWVCEAAGTMTLIFGGLSAVCWNFGGHSLVLHAWGASLTLLLTGLEFAGVGSLVALSPIGRQSGAHVNPVVTLAFWVQRKVHPHDLLGYTAAQLLGATLGALLVKLAWGRDGRKVGLGVTLPGRGVSALEAVGIEAVLTLILVFTLLWLTSHERTARFTPLVLWILIALEVWVGAPYTGTSMNPARSLGPALMLPELRDLWVYAVGPVLGAGLACGAFALVRSRSTLTAKLFHDPRYPSTLGSELPVKQRAKA